MMRQEPKETIYGCQLEAGHIIDVGISQRLGKVLSFQNHPKFAELHDASTARVAVTDRGNITVVDDLPIFIY